MFAIYFLGALYFLSFRSGVNAYNLLQEYKGNTFFNDANGNNLWTWYGKWDNLTLGNVTYLDQQAASAQQLAYVNPAGQAILRVDNSTNVTSTQMRNSIRITTVETYDVGTVWIADISHIPYGCSVWPAFWSVGAVWPDDGEIDIVEAINLQTYNQMALHTTPGCMHVTPKNQTGTSNGLDCSTNSGCVVVENSPDSYGASFATAGGGVWALQFDVSGIFMWFWGRANIPPSITSATSTSSMDISQWGPPSASYPGGTNCNVTQYFGPQNIIFDITLCGEWAGWPSIYQSTCSGGTGNCYLDNVVGNGSNFGEAYFAINYLRTYTNGPVPSATSFPASSSIFTSTASPTTQASKSAAIAMRSDFALVFVAAIILTLFM